jgi:hypothetical protein
MNKDCILDVQQNLKEEGIDVSEDSLTDVALDIDRLINEQNIGGTKRKLGEVVAKLKKDNTDAVAFAARNKMLKLKAKIDFFVRSTELIRLRDEEIASNPSWKITPEWLRKNPITHHDVLEAELVGSQANIPGFRDSVDANTEAIKAQYIGNFLYELDEAGLTKLVTSNKYNADNVANELFNMTKVDTLEAIKREHKVRGDKGEYDLYEGYDPKVSGDKQAYGIAKVMAKAQYELVIRSNRAGSYIKLRSDYIVKQSHNADRLHAAGLEKWRGVIRPLLDEDATFGNKTEEQISEMLDMAFHDIVYGKGDTLGGANIRVGQASKLSRARVLHFKSDKEFMAYNKQFGNKELIDTFLSTVNTMSRDIALMEKLGPNAGNTFDEILADIVKVEANIFRESVKGSGMTDVEIKDRFKRNTQAKELKLRHQFGEVSGATQIPILGKWNDWGKGVRAVHNLSKLGGAGLSALADMGFIPFEAAYQGIGVPKGKGVKNQINQQIGFWRSFVKGMSTPVIIPLRNAMNKVGLMGSRKEQIQLARQIGIGMDYMTSSAMDKFSINDVFDDVSLDPTEVGYFKSVGGGLGALQKKFFKVNGLTWITDSFKGAFTMMAANNLGDSAGKSWSKLNPRLVNVLSKYNIDEADWNLLRSTAFEGTDKNMYITPDKVRYLDKDLINDYINTNVVNKLPEGRREGLEAARRMEIKNAPGTIAQVKIGLETKLRAYFVDRADFASPTPGAKERAFMYKGLEPGTAYGEAVRFFWQYKSFALTIAQKIWGREKNGAYSKPSGAARAAGMLALTTATGMVSYSMKQAFRGEKPDLLKLMDGDTDNEEMIKAGLAGFMQGGGAGIYADLLSSTRTRYGQSAVVALGGPTASVIEDASKMVGLGLSATENVALGNVNKGKRAVLGAARMAKHLTPYGNYPGVKNLLDSYIWYNINESLSPGYMRRLRRSRKKEGTEWYMEPEARNPVDDIQDIFN